MFNFDSILHIVFLAVAALLALCILVTVIVAIVKAKRKKRVKKAREELGEVVEKPPENIVAPENIVSGDIIDIGEDKPLERVEKIDGVKNILNEIDKIVPLAMSEKTKIKDDTISGELERAIKEGLEFDERYRAGIVDAIVEDAAKNERVTASVGEEITATKIVEDVAARQTQIDASARVVTRQSTNLPSKRRYVILDRQNAADIFSEYLENQREADELKKSINTIILK